MTKSRVAVRDHSVVAAQSPNGAKFGAATVVDHGCRVKRSATCRVGEKEARPLIRPVREVEAGRTHRRIAHTLDRSAGVEVGGGTAGRGVAPLLRQRRASRRGADTFRRERTEPVGDTGSPTACTAAGSASVEVVRVARTKTAEGEGEGAGSPRRCRTRSRACFPSRYRNRPTTGTGDGTSCGRPDDLARAVGRSRGRYWESRSGGRLGVASLRRGRQNRTSLVAQSRRLRKGLAAAVRPRDCTSTERGTSCQSRPADNECRE